MQDFAGYAACLTFSSPQPLPIDELSGMVATFLVGVAEGCRAAGATIVGHIKALVETGSGETILASIVGTRSEPRLSWEGDRAAEQWRMTLNVLVYGLAHEQIDRLVREEIAWFEKATGGHIEIEESSSNGGEYKHDE